MVYNIYNIYIENASSELPFITWLCYSYPVASKRGRELQGRFVVTGLGIDFNPFSCGALQLHHQLIRRRRRWYIYITHAIRCKCGSIYYNVAYYDVQRGGKSSRAKKQGLLPPHTQAHSFFLASVNITARAFEYIYIPIIYIPVGYYLATFRT